MLTPNEVCAMFPRGPRVLSVAGRIVSARPHFPLLFKRTAFVVQAIAPHFEVDPAPAKWSDSVVLQLTDTATKDVIGYARFRPELTPHWQAVV